MPDQGGEVRLPDFRYARVPDRLVRDRSLNDRAFRLWVLLARYGEERAWPSRRRLAEELGSTTRAVTNWLRDLRDRGYLTIERRPGSSSVLDLTPAWGSVDNPGDNSRCPGDNSGDPGTAVPGGVEPSFHPHMKENKGKNNNGESSSPGSSPEVLAVEGYWRERLRPRARESKARRSKVAARLREGYSVEELQRAVDGCAASEFHTTNRHVDLTLICRDAAHVDRFIDLAHAVRVDREMNPNRTGPSPQAAAAHLAVLNAAREASGQEPLTELPEEELA